MALPQSPQNLETVDVGQANVEHHEVELLVDQQDVRMPAHRGVFHDVACAREDAGQPFGKKRVVFDDKYSHAGIIRQCRLRLGIGIASELPSVADLESVRQQLDHDRNVATVGEPSGEAADRPPRQHVGLPVRLVLDAPGADV